MIKKKNRKELRQMRHIRIRKHLSGTSERPRLSVFISLKNIYAQVIDDSKGATLVSASTLEKVLGEKVKSGKNIDSAKLVGELIAERALEKGIKEVTFDRGGFLYHGRVKALAEAARGKGLKF
ncbi:MAG: 50S ribosomal protein L18 [Nitrospiraceae bacterium]|nr:50S ribosomal protein L18 [Nitrospiraceae bacterium]